MTEPNWRDRLRRLRRRLRWHQAAEGAAKVLGGFVVVAAVFAWIDWRLEVSAPTRSFVVVFGGIILLHQTIKRLLVPLLRRIDLLDAAALADRGLGRRDADAPAGFAATDFSATAATATLLGDEEGPLHAKARLEAERRLAAVPVEEAAKPRHLWRNAGLAALAVAVPVAAAAAMPWAVRVWADRWIAVRDTPWPRNTSLEVLGLKDGVLQVPRGEAAAFGVAATDKADPTQVVWLNVEPASGADATAALDRYGETPGEGVVTSDFRGELPPLASEATASVWGGDARPLEFTVRPVDRPQVVGLTLTAKHPAEAEPTTYDLAAGGDVRLLKDSRAVLRVETAAAADALAVEGLDAEVRRVGETAFEASWTHAAPAAVRLTLSSEATGLESFPRSVAVGLLPDRPPAVSLRHSGVRLRVTPVAEIPLSASARDDFGVASLTLVGESVRMTVEAAGADEPSEKAEPPKSPGEVVLFEAAGEEPPRRVDREHRLMLEELALKPGDVVKLSARAEDAAYDGAQARASRSVAFRVVKREDLFREVLLRLQQLRSRLRKAADEAEATASAIRSASLPGEASALARRLQVTRREVAAVTTQIDQTVAEMTLNRLGGPETTEIIARTVVSPLERLLSGPMDRQRRAVAGLTGDADGRAEAARRQDEIVASLREALKNMAQWDSFVDVVNQLNAVIGLEKTVQERTDALRGAQPAEPGEEKPPATDAATDVFD